MPNIDDEEYTEVPEIQTTPQTKAAQLSLSEALGLPAVSNVNPFLAGVLGAARGVATPSANVGGVGGGISSLLSGLEAGYGSTQEMAKQSLNNTPLKIVAPALAIDLEAMGITNAGNRTLGQIKDYMPLIERAVQMKKMQEGTVKLTEDEARLAAATEAEIRGLQGQELLDFVNTKSKVYTGLTPNQVNRHLNVLSSLERSQDVSSRQQERLTFEKKKAEEYLNLQKELQQERTKSTKQKQAISVIKDMLIPEDVKAKILSMLEEHATTIPEEPKVMKKSKSKKEEVVNIEL